jgi:5-methyltetrahydrofolate--homocysteine methyltransferase
MELAGATGCPIWLKPNAGAPELAGFETIYKATPAEFAAGATALVKAGVAFIGGCCGTTPEFIAALKIALCHETKAIACAGNVPE